MKPIPNTVIRASAGSGKTFQLTNRLITLLLNDVPIETVLATTFSRKAAREILDRLFVRLAQAADDPKKSQELGQLLGRPLNPSKCLDVLRQLLRKLHLLQVRTLDSFFVRAAQALTLELGLWPDWQIDEGDRTQHLVVIAVTDLLRDRERVKEWMHLLFKGQAVRSITRQIYDLIAQYYEQVFVESQPGAWEIRHPLKPLPPKEWQRCLKRLASYPIDGLKNSLAKAVQADVERATQEDWEDFLQRGLAAKVAAGETRYNRVEIPPELINVYKPLVEHARATLVDRVIMQTAATYELLKDFDSRYRQALREEGYLGFGDVTRLLRDYVRDGGDEAIQRWERRVGWRVNHLLLDEFQDTSNLQWSVLYPFARRICDSHDGSFFCVGDVKQSIYGWRGSEPGIFAHIERALPDVHVEPLDKSWRSSPVIIDVVNRVFSKLSESPVFNRSGDSACWSEAAKSWAARFSPHTTARLEYPGYCCVIVAGTDEQTESDDGVDTGEVEGAIGSLLTDWVREVYFAPAQPTIGILVRKNETISRIAPQLQQAGLPFSQEGRNPITTAVSVQLILNILRIADHPGDTAAIFRVGHSPLADTLGWNTFATWDAAEQLAQARELSRRIRRELLEEGYGPVVRELADALSPFTPLEEHLYLEKLVELSYLYDGQATLRTRDFIAWLDHQDIADPQLARIRIMTIHGAKGLQFDAVFLPDLDGRLGQRQGDLVFSRPAPGEPIDWVCRGLNQKLLDADVFPPEVKKRYEAFRQRCIEEDLSVLYVAMTRAVYGLYMFVRKVPDNSKVVPKTAAGIVCSTLSTEAPQRPGDVIFETGDRQWWTKLPARQSVVTEEPTTPVGTPGLTTKSSAMRSRPWTTPHETEGSDARVDALLRFQPEDALARGNLFHLWFSKVRWLDRDGPPDRDMLRQLAFQFPSLRDHWEEYHAAFVEMLDKPEIRKVLTVAEYEKPTGGTSIPAQHAAALSAPRWKLFLEQPFVVFIDGKYCRGQFDRIIVLFDGERAIAADVIDFKTDEVSWDAVTERLNFYRPQLELYRDAAAEWLHIRRSQVSARLVFVHSGIVHRVA